jgi:hypothetical protein
MTATVKLANQPPSVQETAFEDAAACRRWLASQPQANPVQMQSALFAQLKLLKGATLPPKERMKILDTLRETLSFAQAECARRFTGRALPLLDDERAGLDANRAVWGAAYDGYRTCLDGFMDSSFARADLVLAAARRALWVLAAEQWDCHRARYESDDRYWQRLHRVFSLAEQAGAVDKRLNGAYAMPLLLQAAGPSTLSHRQLQLLHGWLSNWAPKVGISKNAPWSDYPPLAVDLESNQPAAQSVQGGCTRWLDVSRLARSIAKRLLALQKGQSPADLKLGDGCTAQECEAVLRQLYARCCKGHIERAAPRHGSQKHCNLSVGLDATHDEISDGACRPPSEGLSAKQIETIALFGHASAPDQGRPGKPSSRASLERWDIVDESRDGLGLTRSPLLARYRVESGTLLGLQLEDASSMLLGVVRWVMIRSDKKLHVGVKVLPGLPEAVTARVRARDGADAHYVRALLLPEVTKLEQRASIMVPLNWFAEGRILELHGAGPKRIRLTRLCQRGMDFDRVDYIAA